MKNMKNIVGNQESQMQGQESNCGGQDQREKDRLSLLEKLKKMHSIADALFERAKKVAAAFEKNGALTLEDMKEAVAINNELEAAGITYKELLRIMKMTPITPPEYSEHTQLIADISHGYWEIRRELNTCILLPRCEV